MLSFRRCASLLRMNWAGKHGLFPLPDLIIGTLISNFLNLLVKSFCKVRSFFLLLRFSCSSVSVFRVNASVPHTYSGV